MTEHLEPTPASAPAESAAGAATAAAPGAAPAAGVVSVDQAKLALRRVKDPELNLNIIDLGLVYDVRVEGAVVVNVADLSMAAGLLLLGRTLWQLALAVRTHGPRARLGALSVR